MKKVLLRGLVLMKTKDNWSPFRGWVHQLWIQNCDEHDQMGQPQYNIRQYWQTYKHWIRREYRYQQRKTQ